MSDVDQLDRIELELRQAFHRALLPVAPDRLRDELEELVDASPAPMAATERRRGRGIIRVLGLAAVLAIGGALAMMGGGGRLDPPSSPGRGPAVDRDLVRITYAIDWSAAVPATAAARATVAAVLERRVAAIGAAAAVSAGPLDRVDVVVSADLELERIRRVLGAVGEIAFVPLGTDTADVGDPIDPSRSSLFGGSEITSAAATNDQSGQHVIDVQLSPMAARALGAWTRDHVGESLAITMDGAVLFAPRINSEIPGGVMQITEPGGWQPTEAADTVALLVGGRLPAPMRETSVVPERGILPALPSLAALPPSPVATPAPAVTCEPPMNRPGELDCEDGVTSAIAALPLNHPRITAASFAHACNDVIGRAAADCLVEAFGNVRLTFATGRHLIVGVSTSDGPPMLVLDPGADGPVIVPIPATVGASCSPVPARPFAVSLQIPVDGGPILGISAPGQVLPVAFGRDLFRVTEPVGFLLSDVPTFGPTLIRAADGKQLVVGGSAENGTLRTCLTDDGAVLVAAAGKVP